MLKRIGIHIRQMHKRRGFLVLAVAIVILLTAGGLSLIALIAFDEMASASLINIRIDPDEEKTSVIGSGIDIAQLPVTNMLRDPSFEPEVFKESLTVQSGTSKVIVVSNKETGSGKYPEGFFTGGDVRVTALSENGFYTKKTGRIVRYSPDRIDEFNLAPVTGDIPQGAKLYSVAAEETAVVAVGENGIIITGINTQSPAVRYSGISSNIIDVCSGGGSFYACTGEGQIIVSDDAVIWENLISPVNIELNSIAASDNAFVAAGSAGEILLGLRGVIYSYYTGFDSDITDIVYDGNAFVAVTSSGEIISSSNGMIWKLLSETDSSFLSIEYADSTYVITDTEDNVLVYSDLEDRHISSEHIEQGIADTTLISDAKILVLTKEGYILETDDFGKVWTDSGVDPFAGCDMLTAIDDGEIICSAGIRETYVSRLVTEIEVDSTLQTGSYQAGEICYLNINYPDMPGEERTPWKFYGEGGAEKILGEGSSHKGLGQIKLISEADDKGYAVLSQQITDESSGEKLAAGGFYVMTLWIRQETLTNQKVKVWVSGSFSGIGTEFSNVGTMWNKYTFKFSMPRGLIDSAVDQARINIGMTGPGIFYFDDVYLARVDDQQEAIPAGFKEDILSADPATIRISWLGIGSGNMSENSWAYDGSLDMALTLIQNNASRADPWITIDSHVSESELRNLMEYLCGPISSTYGNIRHLNGRPVPWADSFERIFFEFTDTEDIFMNDTSRAYYVNSCIKAVESSAYYDNVSGSLITVDNMSYSEGLMLSRADYFSIDFFCDVYDIKLKNVLDRLDEMVSRMPRNPDRPSDLPFGMVRSTSLVPRSEAYTMADHTVILLETLGKRTSSALATWEGEPSPTLLAATGLAARAAKGNRVALIKESLSEVTGEINCYAFEDGTDMHIVITSHDDDPAAVSLDIPVDGREVHLVRYDPGGQVIEERRIRRTGGKINIMPDNVIYIKMYLPEEQENK